MCSNSGSVVIVIGSAEEFMLSISMLHYKRRRHRACCHFLQNWCDILVKFSKLFNFHPELELGLMLSQVDSSHFGDDIWCSR